MYARRATKRGPQAGDASDGILRCVYERPTTTLLRLEWGVWHAYCHVHVAWTRGFGWALVSLGRALPWRCQFFIFFFWVWNEPLHLTIGSCGDYGQKSTCGICRDSVVCLQCSGERQELI